MPRPVFIVCAQYGTEDKSTGQMSLFGIVDKLVMSIIPQPITNGMVVVHTTSLYIAAKWMKNTDDDQEQMYEVTLRGISSDGKILVDSAFENFKFAENRPLHIVAMLLRNPIPVTEAGTMSFVCSLKKADSDDKWISQEYPIIIETVSPPT